MIWYSCASYGSDSISDWNNFFVFNSFQIILACCFRKIYARLIFIELFINRISLHSFFFFLYINWCVQAREWFLSCITKMTLFVYYKAFVCWLYVDNENFIKTLYLRSACDTSALQQYFNILLSLFMTSWFWEFLSFLAIF